MHKDPGFNAEELAAYKATVSLDVLYRWAEALTSASGTISGTAKAFRAAGRPVEVLDAEEAHLDEVRAEIFAKMKEGIKV